jgi:hypothetical protein
VIRCGSCLGPSLIFYSSHLDILPLKIRNNSEMWIKVLSVGGLGQFDNDNDDKSLRHRGSLSLSDNFNLVVTRRSSYCLFIMN